MLGFIKFALIVAVAAGIGWLVFVYDWEALFYGLGQVGLELLWTVAKYVGIYGGGAVALYLLYRFIKERRTKNYHRQIDSLKGMTSKASSAHGSADFANSGDLQRFGLLGQDEGFVLGKFNEQFVILPYSKPGHLITFAPTRSGKGVGQVIPNLLTHTGSVVVNDIKGENFAVTGRHRANFSKVYRFAPFEDDSDCFNPLDFIRVGTEDEMDDANLIADMIVPEEKSNDPFWDREAKNLVTGLIMFVATSAPPPLRNMSEVRFLLMQSKKDFDVTIKKMLESENAFVKRVANSVTATEAKVLASVISTAKSKTAIWDSPKLAKVTAKSDFTMEDIKKEVISLYIVIPPEQLSNYKPVVRLMIGLATTAMTRLKQKPTKPVLFLIDEFPALGHMEPIESGIGYLAGYGVVLWMFIQDLNQLRDIYERWGTFISNCSVRVAFGTNDVDTAKTLSEMLGTTTIKVESTSRDNTSFRIFNKADNINSSETSRALMTPDEVMRLPNDSQLVFVQGCKPIVAEKIFYFKDPAFVGMFDSW